MVPPPSPFRLVYRAFERIEYDAAKNEEIFARRAFDLAFAARMFPGYVLERKDTRFTSEARYQVIGEVFGRVYFLVYTLRQGACRVITAWEATSYERELWDDFTR